MAASQSSACVVTALTRDGPEYVNILHLHLARKGANMLHPSPAQPELSDIFTVKVMILGTRNEWDPAWPVDSGISLMNWTRKPCWHKEEVFSVGVTN